MEVLGRVLSYGYISSGFVPVKISFPTLAAILVTSFSEITAEMFLQSFKDYLTQVDLFTIKDAFCQKEYSRQLTTKLINIFSRFDCLEVPKPGNILRLCQQSCKYCIGKPFSAIMEMKKGLSSQSPEILG